MKTWIRIGQILTVFMMISGIRGIVIGIIGYFKKDLYDESLVYGLILYFCIFIIGFVLFKISQESYKKYLKYEKHNENVRKLRRYAKDEDNTK